MRLTVSLLALAATILAVPTVVYPQSEPRHIAQFSAMVATVAAIDAINRKVTLRGSTGDTHVITVGEHIHAFDDLEVGDVVEMEYFQDMVTEIRPPTAEEFATPLRIVQIRPEDSEDRREISIVHAVVIVDAVDKENMTVTVHGPMGTKRTFPVIFPERIEQLEVGKTVVVTYTEAAAVSLIER